MLAFLWGKRGNKLDIKKIVKLVHSTRKFIFDEQLRSNVKVKGPQDYVTAVDLTISNYLKTELHKLYPDIAFMCEEESTVLCDKCWILDPIDGTTNLIFDYKMSTVSLALYQNNCVTFGIVYNPFSRETFLALKGKGAYVNGKKITVNKHSLNESIIEFGLGASHKEFADSNFAIAKEIFKQCLDIRRVGSAAITLCYIACGRLDGYLEKNIHPWDYAAGMLMIQEAGGFVTTWDNLPMPLNDAGTILATNGLIHNGLINIIAKNI